MNRASRPSISRALSALRLSARQCAQTQTEEANDILPPFRIHRTPTSVLEAIASSSRRPISYHPDVHPADPTYLKNSRHGLFNLLLEYKLKGRQSARYIINNVIAGDLAPLRTEEPRIRAFDARFTMDQLNDQEPSEEILERLIALGQVSEAWEMYETLGTDAVTSTTRLKLLDLLCAFNSRYRPLLQTDPFEIFFGKAHAGISNTIRRVQKFEDNSWTPNGHAEKLFASLDAKEKGPGFRAMVRGMVRYGSYDRALKLHRESVLKGFSGDLKSYNAALKCVHCVELYSWKQGTMNFNPWRAGLDMLYEMRDAGIQPDTETFNSLIFSLAFSVKKRKMKSISACKAIMSLLKEMEALKIAPNVGTLTNVLRLADNMNDSNATQEAVSFKIDSETKRVMSELMDYVIEELSKDKGRKRFATEFDLETIFLISSAKFCHKDPAQVAVKLHYLLRDSPGLAMQQSKWMFYLSELLWFLGNKDEAACVDILEEEMSYTSQLRLSLKLRIVDAYAAAKPERMHIFFEGLINQTNINRNNIGIRLFYACLIHTKDNHDHCRDQIYKALKALHQRSTMDYEILKIFDSEFVSNFYHLLLPDNISTEISSEELELGWQLFDHFNDHKMEAFLKSPNRLLHLAYGLLNIDRNEDGLQIINAILSNEISVFSSTEKSYHNLIGKLMEHPAIQCHEELVNKLKAAKRSYNINRTKERIVNVHSVVEGSGPGQDPFKRTREDRPFRAKSLRKAQELKENGVADSSQDGVPSRNRYKTRNDEQPIRMRRRRDSAKPVSHTYGIPDKFYKRPTRLQKLPQKMTDVGSEEHWPSPEDADNTSSSSSSDEEL